MNYGGYGYGYAPGYAPYVASAPYSYPLAPYYPNGVTFFGAEEASTMDKAKLWLNTDTAGVPRKYLVAGAGAIGLIILGASQGWFGR